VGLARRLAGLDRLGRSLPELLAERGVSAEDRQMVVRDNAVRTLRWRKVGFVS
jgi:hypothetical protein